MVTGHRVYASNAGSADAAKRRVTLEPPGNGTIFRVVEFPPDAAPGGFDREAAFRAMGAGHAMDPDASRHPGMHRTDTVYYAIVLSGEIWALMEDGEALMRAGDTLVQRTDLLDLGAQLGHALHLVTHVVDAAASGGADLAHHVQDDRADPGDDVHGAAQPFDELPATGARMAITVATTR